MACVACGSEQGEGIEQPAGNADGDDADEERAPAKELDAGRIITPTREASLPTAPSSATTYTEHVRPILARACLTCHTEGNIAPFSLESYERAKPFAKLIAKATRARTMPPSVVDNTGACNTFRELPWLTDAEIETIERWASDGAPEGDTSIAAPAIKPLPKLEGKVHSLRTPSYKPSTEKLDDYRCFVLDSPFEANTFVTGYDTHPGDSKTAHHMVVFYPMDEGSALIAKVLDQLEDGPGYTCFGAPGVPATVIAAWAPGAGATKYPANLGVQVHAGRPIIIQMHYNTAASMNPGEDSTQVDLEYGEDGITEGAFANMLDLEMDLAPGKESVTEVVSDSIGASMSNASGPMEVYGVFPHMHELGKHLKVTYGAQETCLVDAPRYQFHWQRMYFFDKPITIDAADAIKVHCNFDTTSRTTATKWGEGTQDEMCVTGLFVKRKETP